MSKLTHLLACQNITGEGPLWHPNEYKLYWVDILGEKIQRYDPQSFAYEQFTVGEPISVIGLREKGGFIAAGKQGFAFWDAESNQVKHITHPEQDKPEARFNDGKVDHAGRFWAGTMTPQGATSTLYRLDPDLQVHRMVEGVTISNGIGWSPDSHTMYYVDTLRYVLYAYDFDLELGKISNRRTLVQLSGEQGVPDGLTVDAEGCIWCAIWGGWKVIRYSPEGESLEEVQVPVAQPSCCAFGGEKLDTLFITTAREGLSAAELAKQPLAGDLFAFKPGVNGLLEPEFKG
ncbi:MAG TPA: SMP-30/gluconolactonase/LRE family protein [Anaerolineae bacterium]|nr:SMP-30/gluconolactonase/LRE family protein [Anaerolineae bacterium]